MDPTFLLLSVAAPLGIAVLFVAAAFLFTRGTGRTTPRAWAAFLGLALAFPAGVRAILGHPVEWPPAQAADWLPFLAAAALLLGAVDLLLPRKPWAWALLLAMLLGLAAGVLAGSLASAVRHGMGAGAVKTLWTAGVVVAIALPALAARAGARGTPNAGPVFALGLLTACTIAAALLFETAKYAQFASLLGLGLAPLGVATLILRPWPTDRGLAPVFSALNATLWLLLHFYAEVPAPAALVGAAAPAALLVARLPGLSTSPKRAGLAQVAAVTLLGLTAVGLAYAGKPAPAVDDGASMYPTLSP